MLYGDYKIDTKIRLYRMPSLIVLGGKTLDICQFYFSVVCLGFVYIVAGVLFNKLYRKETGKDVLPNTGFWGSLPGLVKVGLFENWSEMFA